MWHVMLLPSSRLCFQKKTIGGDDGSDDEDDDEILSFRFCVSCVT